MGIQRQNISGLTETQKKLLVLTAVGIPPVSLDLLASAGGFSPVEALQALQHLVENRLLEIDPSGGFGYYRLSEPQKSAEILAWIGAPASTETVEKMARHLEESLGDTPGRWAALAHLQTVSGMPFIGPAGFLEAARFLREKRRTARADRYFEQALALLPNPCAKDSDKLIFIEAAHGLLSTRYKSMPLPDQKALLDRAGTYAKEIGAEEWRIRLSISFARLCSYAGDHQRAAKLSDEAWRRTEKGERTNLRRWVALSTAEFLAWEGRLEEALNRYENAIGNLEEFSSDSATLRACAWLGYRYSQCGQTARGIGLIEAVRGKAGELNHRTALNWATLLLSMTLAEIGRLEEAETVSAFLSKRDEEESEILIPWLLNYIRAYLRFKHNDLEGCRTLHNRASDMLESLGWWHLPIPFILEYLEALDETGEVPPKTDLKAFIEESLAFPDIFMQGVALRFGTQQRLKGAEPCSEDFRDLERSLELLEKSGARLQRSYTQILLARLWMARGEEGRALPLLREAWDVLSGVNEALFPEDLKSLIDPADREERLARSVIEVGNALGSVRRREKLIRKIIQVTMNFTRVEKGAMFLLDKTGGLEPAASRNMDSSAIRSGEFQKKLAWIKDAAVRGRELILAPRGGADSARRLPSVQICAPMALGNKVFGVLYLESGRYGSTFSKKELPFLRALCNQAAVALDNIYAYEEISDLKERLLAETRLYHEDLRQELPAFGKIVGESKGMRDVFAKIKQVAETDATVLITGETGVGKELVARSIHQLSKRSNGPFIALNTAALDSNLVGSELFGHEKGAFTNAIATRLGRFELADRGTLFLDDVDNLKPDIQAKLLRVVQEKEFERIGGKKTIQSDFRLITATNRNLKTLVARESFREDLFYRLNTFPIHIPPLRERRKDISKLAHFFLDHYNKKLGKRIHGIANAEMKRLEAYNWPGNVRELKHVIERAAIISTNKRLNIPDLEENSRQKETGEKFKTLKEMEKAHIIQALERSGYKVSGKDGAAELLGLKTSTLNSKMKRLGISRNVRFLSESTG